MTIINDEIKYSYTKSIYKFPIFKKSIEQCMRIQRSLNFEVANKLYQVHLLSLMSQNQVGDTNLSIILEQYHLLVILTIILLTLKTILLSNNQSTIRQWKLQVFQSINENAYTLISTKEVKKSQVCLKYVRILEPQEQQEFCVYIFKPSLKNKTYSFQSALKFKVQIQNFTISMLYLVVVKLMRYK
ncbi:unnamed protein product (macronuclear) [Paramecium tetraurelia]|uniref:Transmembrane protein n=1 Tax=Paramecium tetraurelia TaxID=5888 RepID=A0DM85_PARTE|nr:uncharacterized protein GSPATT00018370001 [Paramecium tetraurelia]CAK84152.1 unnamed protein product [Paramecium tetraurelia]|eukprot:XP_001451549.1 hypothetical protein (macronuclear) [Paramecium tetraurelia strain d4-2]